MMGKESADLFDQPLARGRGTDADSDALSITKKAPVPISHFSRLLDSLEQPTLLVVVAGPKGSGKSTAIAAWSLRSDKAAVLLKCKTLSESKVVRFALVKVWVPEGSSPNTIDPCANLIDKANITLDEVCELSAHATIAIDDVDEVASDLKFNAIASRFVAQREGGHTIFLLPKQSDTSLMQWMSKFDAIKAISWDSIVISPDELYQVALQHRMLPRSVVLTWSGDVCGWILGVVLLAEAQAGASVRGFGLPRQLQNFFRERIYENQPKPFRGALEAAVGIGYFNAEVLGKLGIQISEISLLEGSRACAGFIQRSNRTEVRYELTPLFRRFIWGELIRERGLEETTSRSRQISLVLASQGWDTLPNLDVLVAQHDYKAIRALLDDTLAPLRTAARWEVAPHLMAKIPRGFDASNPVIAFWRAWDAQGVEVDARKALFMLAADGYVNAGEYALALASWNWAAALITMRFGAGDELDRSVAWIERVDIVLKANWYLKYPVACATVALILGQRNNQPQKAELWRTRTLQALSLNSTRPPGHLNLVGLLVLLFIDLNAVRLSELCDWCVAADDVLIGSEPEKLRTLARGLATAVEGNAHEAAIFIEKSLFCSDSDGGIPVSDALVFLCSSWFGLTTTLSAEERYKPLIKWKSNTSDFYCLKLLSIADVTIQLNQQLKTRRLVEIAHDLTDNLEFGLIREHALLCVAQYACLVEDWHLARGVLAKIELLKAQGGRFQLFDLQYSLISGWIGLKGGADLSDTPSPTAEIKLLDTLSSCKGSWIPLHPRLATQVSAAVAVGVGGDSGREKVEIQAQTKGELRLNTAKTGLAQDAQGAKLYIRSFGTRKLVVHRIHTEHESRVQLHLQSKLEILLRAIVVRSTISPPSVEDLCDDLWPDAEGDAAKRNFDSTVLRLRRALGGGDSILIKGGTVSINKDVVAVDLHRAFAIMNQTEEQRDQIPQVVKQLQRHIVGPLQLQTADLPHLAQITALISCKIRARLIHLAAVAESFYQLEEASQVYSLALAFGAGPEAVTALIRTLEALGKSVEAEVFFQQYKDALKSKAHSK